MRPSTRRRRHAVPLALLLGAAQAVIAAPDGTEQATASASAATATAPRPIATPEQVLLRRLQEFIDGLRGKPLEPGCMEG